MAEKDQRLNEIPKLIHYCWFGGNELPDLALKCIESWKNIVLTTKLLNGMNQILI